MSSRRAQKTISVNRMKIVVQNVVFETEIESDDIFVDERRIIEEIEKEKDEKVYVDFVQHHDENSQKQLKQLRESIVDRINRTISIVLLYSTKVTFQLFAAIDRDRDREIDDDDDDDNDSESSLFESSHESHDESDESDEFDDSDESYDSDEFDESEKSDESEESEESEYSEYFDVYDDASVSIIHENQLIENKSSTFHDKERNHVKSQD